MPTPCCAVALWHRSCPFLPVASTEWFLSARRNPELCVPSRYSTASGFCSSGLWACLQSDALGCRSPRPESGWLHWLRALPSQCSLCRASQSSRTTVLMCPSWSPSKLGVLCAALHRAVPTYPASPVMCKGHCKRRLTVPCPKERGTGPACFWLD